ncbi:MAG: hypothetical protein ABI024_14635 [Vicinamibacterales bacterium]
MTSALGTSAPALLASTAAIAALLYAGGVWFGGAATGAAPSILVFNHTLMISGGPLSGKPVASQFPVWMRSEIRRRCEAAIRGEYSRFTCADGLRSRTFDAAPITNAEGSIVCGVLIEGAAIPAPTLLGEPALMPDAAI